jgi:pyruvate,water dikinase
MPGRPAARLALGWLGATLVATAVPAQPVADTPAPVLVEPSRIEAGLFYSGATVTVRGRAGVQSQVVVQIAGPSEPQTFNRRDRIAGFIWGGVEHVTFRRAPSVYGLFTSAALASIASADLRAELGIGYEALRLRVEVAGTSADAHAMLDQLVRLKEGEGLYRVASGAVHMEDAEDGHRPFSVDIPLPPGTPPGLLQVTAFEFTRGALARTTEVSVRLERVGLPASLFSLAHEHGLGYGLLAVVVMLATGLSTGLAASGRRRAVLPGGAPAGITFTAKAASIAREITEALRPRGLVLRSPADVAALQAKYHVFRDLLAVNHELLGLLAELEEEASWTSFRQPRVRMGIRALFDGTADMVALLNQLSGDRYFDLANVVSSIRRDVMDFLGRLKEEEDPRLALQLAEISSATAARVGGKALNLARLDGDLGVRVPPFFVITTEAYREFLERDGLGSKLRSVLAPARVDVPDDFSRRCELAQSLIDHAPAPPGLADAVRAAWDACAIPPGEGAAVRSSAAGEDSELSFAGQFESVLNVPRDEVIDAWKRVVRSRFAPRAVFYRRAAGLAEVDTPMAVMVQRMISARASGVLFTRPPNDPKAPSMLLTSVFGLGPEASAGTAAADQLVVARRSPHAVLERHLARKGQRLLSDEAGGVARIDVDPDAQLRASVSDEEAAALAERALAIESYFGRAQDLEWTVDADGLIWILQARPLRVEKAGSAGADVPADAPLLVRGGDIVWSGRAVGPVHVLRTPADEEQLPTGAVLVTAQLLPDCVRFLPRVSAVLVERGSITGHAASIVREFRVPSLFGIERALDTLVPGQVVSVDVASRRVFAGALWPELRGQLPVALEGSRAAGLPTVLAGKLTKLSGSRFMSSWACQSLHDVIRFAHEMAIEAMFEVGDRLLESPEGAAKRLECPPPMYMHLVDLGGGLTPEAASRRSVPPEAVVSAPFQALWRGLGDDGLVQRRLGRSRLRTFGALMASTVSADGLRDVGTPNYACLTDSYLNLNSRQAYHFAIVDAMLCENQNSNHISFRFKGGGAAPWQRALRVQFMAEVLRLHRFTVSVTGDLLNAWVRGFDLAIGARELTTIGHLLRFSAQLDLWMEDPAETKEYVAAFVEAEEAALASGRAGTS